MSVLELLRWMIPVFHLVTGTNRYYQTYLPYGSVRGGVIFAGLFLMETSVVILLL